MVTGGWEGGNSGRWQGQAQYGDGGKGRSQADAVSECKQNNRHDKRWQRRAHVAYKAKKHADHASRWEDRAKWGQGGPGGEERPAKELIDSSRGKGGKHGGSAPPMKPAVKFQSSSPPRFVGNKELHVGRWQDRAEWKGVEGREEKEGKPRVEHEGRWQERADWGKDGRIEVAVNGRAQVQGKEQAREAGHLMKTDRNAGRWQQQADVAKPVPEPRPSPPSPNDRPQDAPRHEMEAPAAMANAWFKPDKGKGHGRKHSDVSRPEREQKLAKAAWMEEQGMVGEHIREQRVLKGQQARGGSTEPHHHRKCCTITRSSSPRRPLPASWGTSAGSFSEAATWPSVLISIPQRHSSRHYRSTIRRTRRPQQCTPGQRTPGQRHQPASPGGAAPANGAQRYVLHGNTNSKRNADSRLKLPYPGTPSLCACASVVTPAQSPPLSGRIRTLPRTRNPVRSALPRKKEGAQVGMTHQSHDDQHDAAISMTR
ncbi:hypothetical protein CYMTET_34538 [Cymbomonas tetramitiformis]|uniref:Uncharacterized protein n=1 Tax=Cymbomonas tetramitiformis TaxID=36881 RepID=A0AAE0FB43_9CHLO|nr:hypothetical protein CYMTET_34538 [Cymbomonas tetramitiformis]